MKGISIYKMQLIILGLSQSLLTYGQHFTKEKTVDYRKCALELFDILKTEQYDSLDKFIVPFEHAKLCRWPEDTIPQKNYLQYVDNFYKHYKVAHDSIGFEFWPSLKVYATGVEPSYYSLICINTNKMDSMEVYDVTLITDGGLFRYYELKFALNEINGRCVSYFPSIRAKMLNFSNYRRTSDIVYKKEKTE